MTAEAKRHLLAINTDPKVLVDAAQNRNFAARGDGTAYESRSARTATAAKEIKKLIDESVETVVAGTRS
jgi:hypothetical protein